MKILLIYPQTQDHGNIPIALTLLSAVLKKAGHGVEIFDCSWYDTQKSITAKKESRGMFKPTPPAPVEPPPQGKIENLEKDLTDAVNIHGADVVGITSTSGTYPQGLICCKFVKKNCPKALIIMGGIHPTVCPEEVILEDCVDVICIGEGEDAFVEMCDAIEAKRSINRIKNLWVKDANDRKHLHKNPLRPLKDLDSLPAQDFSGFHEYEFYSPLAGNLYKMLNTDLSRGCPFKCHYCSNCYLQGLFKELGTYHRRKSPGIAIKQIKELKEKYQFNAVRFWDEDFTVFPNSYLKELTKLYKKEIGLPFVVYAGTRTVTEEKVGYLKEMGCTTMAMAIESGNYWVRKNILNRDITDEDIVEKYAIVKESGIRVSAYNMIGLPFETRTMVFDTIRLNRRVKPATSSVAAWMPYPKTRLSRIAKEYGMVKDNVDFSGLYTSLESPHLSSVDIDGLLRTFSFYTKLPEEFFPDLEKCEKDESFANEKFPEMLKYMQEHGIE